MSRLTRKRNASRTPTVMPSSGPMINPTAITTAVRPAAKISAVEKSTLPKCAALNCAWNRRSRASDTRAIVVASAP